MEATDAEERTPASSTDERCPGGVENGSLEGEAPKQIAPMGDEDGDGIFAQQLAGPALNQQLLDQLNGQFQKQLQLAEREQLDDGFKISVYADWVASLRTINTELVESLREMQDTCLERMQLMRASYLKDLVRFGPDIRLKRLETMGPTEPSDNGTADRVLSLELSSNYPIIPSTDELLLREVDTKSREVNELRKTLDDQRRLSDDREALVEQLRDLAEERDKQLDEKAKELGVLQQRIDLLNIQLAKAKMSAAALTDNKSLISEITDHHDKITQLRQRLKEQEDNLREANVAIQFRDEVIAQQRQEIKVLTENATSKDKEGSQEDDKSFHLPRLSSSRSFHSIISEDDSGHAAVEPLPVVSVSSDLFGTIQKQSETESQCVATLKRELAEMHSQLHEYKRRALSVTPELTISQGVTDEAFLRLRTVCGELLQSTGKFVCAPGGSPVETGRFENVEQLIILLQDRCEALCRKLSEHASCTMDQDEGIGSGNTSRMGTLSEAHQISQQQRQYAETVVSTMVEQLEHMLGKENVTSASESLSSFSLGLDDGCALQGLLEDLKKEIDAKERVLRDRQAELERSQEQLASTERQLKHLRAKQSTFDNQKAALEAKIFELEQIVDDQGRIIMMLKSQNTNLQQQAEDLKETLQQYRDNLQKTSEEMVAIEDELNEQRTRYFALLKTDVQQMQEQLNGVRSEIVSRQQDLGHLSFFREKCAEMERIHEVELCQQRTKHSNELKELRREIEHLSNQLANSLDSSKQHEQTVEELATLQATIVELGEHNKVLEKTIQSYQDSIVQLEQQLGGSEHQLSIMKQEMDELRVRCTGQENKIGSLRTEKDRVASELSTHRRMCKCGFNNGASCRERAKTPLSHSLQKQLDQKTREATRAQEELVQRCEDWKKREAEYVEHRIMTTEQTTKLIEQLSELKGRNSILEQSMYAKSELLDRLQHNLRDVNRKLASTQEQLAEVERKYATAVDSLEKAQKDALMCEKRCMEELSNVRRCSMDQKNQLQQYETQIGRLRAEVDDLSQRCKHITNERDEVRTEMHGLRERLASFEGKESALCEVVKSNQDELAIKSTRLLELEETNRKLSSSLQQVQSFSDGLSKQYHHAQAELDQVREMSAKLMEFKQKTLNTKDLTRKSLAEWKEREACYNQEILRLKKRTEMLEQDRTKLVSKLHGYHRDNTLLSRKMQQQQQHLQQHLPPSRQHSPYDDNRRGSNLTPLHQTFYPPEAFKLARSSSDPNCTESNELLQKVEFTSGQLQQIRKFWHQGIKEVFPTAEP
ncbi:myosin-10-like isoform X3 [Anopheles albimanus]|uniref:myosin-10-like isoform X3 n=1 Tax=Anopheles albimanus TaxID=7167 RepID=UPI00164177C3|nr:myosin-10-like isoform X3 [Anopheles albimanus]